MSTQQDVPGDAQRPEPEIHDEPGLRLVDNTTSGRVELWLDQTFIGFEGVEKHPDGTSRTTWSAFRSTAQPSRTEPSRVSEPGQGIARVP